MQKKKKSSRGAGIERKTPRPKELKIPRKVANVRVIGTPFESYMDVHGDKPPYTDTHPDGGTYYDHPDSEHNDFHHDEAGKYENYYGNPAILVSQAIDRLSGVMSQFEAMQKNRMERLSLEITGRIEQLEVQLTELRNTRLR